MPGQCTLSLIPGGYTSGGRAEEAESLQHHEALVLASCDAAWCWAAVSSFVFGVSSRRVGRYCDGRSLGVISLALPHCLSGICVVGSAGGSQAGPCLQ